MPSERTRKRLSICALSLALALRLPGGSVMPSGAAPGALLASVVAGAAVAVPDRPKRDCHREASFRLRCVFRIC